MDIVERLGELRLGNKEYDVVVDAIDEIELLRKERDRLREALKKMNDEQCQQIDMAKQKSIEDTRKEIIARAALKGGE